MGDRPEAVWIDGTPFCPICHAILDQEDQDFDSCATCGRDEAWLEEAEFDEDAADD